MIWDTISQIVIFVLGIGSIVLVARKNKWGFVLGLLTQPFWYITSYINKQWGVFFVSIAYTISWGYGVYEWFHKDRRKKRDVVKK